jgi:hypothetical protein
MRTHILFLLAFLSCLPFQVSAQINEDQTGAWFMYFFNASFKPGNWGVQGDIQYRNWNIAGDLEQLLLRGGITYSPRNANILFTAGYGHITTGAFGSDKSTTAENRIYQEALVPVQLGHRVYTSHRFRFEQRFVEDQDLRTRFRYNIFLNIPLNHPGMDVHTLYLALYNEIFINGQRRIGMGKEVELFDRNRAYIALGYILSKGLKIQLGIMNQTTDYWSKNQLQASVHQSF